MTREDFIAQEIEAYRKKIETYQAMIAEWEKELGRTSPTPGNGGTSEPSGTKKAPVAGDPLSMIHGMVFFGKSQPEAAKAFLEMVHYPLTTIQILQGIEKGGVPVGGKTPVAKKQNLYTILDRSSELVRVGRGTWAVAGWPGVPKRSVAEPEAEDKKNQKDAANEPAS
jgi:hypothetical protein